MPFDPSKPNLNFNAVPATQAGARHPASVNPDENALIIPENEVVSQRGNEQVHVIPRRDAEGRITLRMMIYVNGGMWQGQMWYGYQKSANAQPPVLTVDGARRLSEGLAAMVKAVGG